jgi:hypothetical protein
MKVKISSFFAGLLLNTMVSGYIMKPVPPLPSPSNPINVSTPQQLVVALSSAQNGQTIVLADGQYNVGGYEPLTVSRSVTIRGASDDPSGVVLSGRGFANSDKGEEMIQLNASNVTIAYLTLQEVRANCLKLQSTANHNLLVHNVHFLNIGERCIKGPGGSFSNNGEVRYCIFEQSKPVDPNRDDGFGGNYIAGMDMMVIDGWNIHDNVFLNIQGATGMGRGAVFIWRDSRNCIVQNNVFIGCDASICIWEPSSNMTIRNNFIVPGIGVGISVNSSVGIKIYNNTSFHSVATNNGIFRLSNATNAEVKNNIIQSGISVQSGPAPDTAGNIILLRAQMRAAEAWFVNFLEGDLHLTAQATQAIDKGVTISSVTTDWDGDPRTGSYDIGADEYDGTSSLNRIALSNPLDRHLRVYPNPFCTSVSLGISISNSKFQISNFKFEIFNMEGKQIYSAPQACSWDGLDNQGRQVPNGTYLIKLHSGKQASVSKVILKR